MKILPVKKIREADSYTILNEPITDIDLMERAATECFYWFIANIPHHRKILIFCGPGNNGGDGFATGRMLLQKGYQVEAFLAGTIDKLSPSCSINYRRFLDTSGSKFKLLQEGNIFPEIGHDDVVVDALFGSGLTRPVDGFMAKIISEINHCGALVVAIDVPSGLLCDETSIRTGIPVIIKADHTLTFSPPKLALFFPENDPFLGDWKLLDIGIMQEFIDSAKVRNIYLDRQEVVPILRARNKFAHKGLFGHAFLLCGSKGKLGAAVLAAKACLRSGPGLVTVGIPKTGIQILQSSVPEAMLSIGSDEDYLAEIPDLTPYTSIAVGPGIGMNHLTATSLKILIQSTHQPIIFDADAINLLGENKTWLAFIPQGSIFTPHPKEFERLVGKCSNHFERNQMQREFSFKYHCYVILKGAYTAITTPEGLCYFNSTGNPGMATGGSGDVLTGILAGIKAQGYSSLESCLIGVYIHGLAGDLALSTFGFEALIAGDIIENLGKAFKSTYGKL